MPYIALKPITVGMERTEQPAADGTLTVVETPIVRLPGELVPEAEKWSNVGAYVNQGILQYQADEIIALVARVDQLEAEVRSLRAAAHQHNQQTKTEKKGQ